jgi:Methyltransferase domain
MPPESDFTSASDFCPHPELWSARDTSASEFEVGDFLYGLIRLLKPSVVIETGCYLGDTTELMGQALAVNRFGHLWACDLDEKAVIATLLKVHDLPVTVVHSLSSDLLATTQHVDLAFLDGGDRLKEARSLKHSPRAFVAMHDAKNHNFSQLEQELGWKEMFFPIPRGLSLFQTP